MKSFRNFCLLLMALVAYADTSVGQSLFVGSGDWTEGVARNDVFDLEIDDGSAVSLASMDVWGATWDGNETVYFSSIDGSSNSGVGNNLWAYNVVTDDISQVGVVRGFEGSDIRLDGMAYSNGQLYAWNQFPRGGNAPGLYTIDLNTLKATGVLLPAESNISAIDADPLSGILYGADDELQSLVEIDPSAGTITPIAPYPFRVADVDGLAAGPGTLYLVEVIPNTTEIRTWDIATETFQEGIPTPFQTWDLFAGAAYYGPVPEPSSFWLGFNTLLIATILCISRNKKQKQK